MSRRRRELRLQAEEAWPTLYQFLAAYCHEDLKDFHGTPDGAVDAAVSDYNLELRQTVLREWRDWMNTMGSAYDPRAAVNEGLSVNVRFDAPEDARQFMNMVYDKLIISVRNETKDLWNPEWKR